MDIKENKMKRLPITREECRRIQVEILMELDHICRINHLKYYVAYGTALGAIRHRGFIPWDDDIDICLQRCDYDKLLILLKNQQDTKWLSVLDSNTENYLLPFAKAIDNRTVAKSEDSKVKHGIWVDIFPMDTAPDKKNVQRRFLQRCFLFRSIIIAMNTDFDSKKSHMDKKRCIKQLLNILAILIGKKRILKWNEKYMKKHNGTSSIYVCNLCTPYILKEIFQRSELQEVEDIYFERQTVMGLKNADRYLRMLYGNYMQLPPEDERRTHSITAWYIN